jgi:hypothetical protein
MKKYRLWLKNAPALAGLLLILFLPGCASVREWWDVSKYTQKFGPGFTPGESFFQSVLKWWDVSKYTKSFTITEEFNAVLTRSADNQYILNYEGVRRGEIFHDELSAPSLNALLDMMQQNDAVFNQESIETVRTQAALIPAENISENELTGIKQILNDFYFSPTQAKFNALAEKYHAYNLSGGDAGKVIAVSIYKAVYELNPDLAAKLIAR